MGHQGGVVVLFGDGIGSTGVISDGAGVGVKGSMVVLPTKVSRTVSLVYNGTKDWENIIIAVIISNYSSRLALPTATQFETSRVSW